MKKTIISLCIVLGALVISIAYYEWDMHSIAQSVTPGHALSDSLYKTKEVTIRNTTIHALVADSAPLQSLGLGGRDGLEVGQGMLFIFAQSGIYPFWMKDMHFAIDIIWISADKKIVYMAQDITPSTYPSTFGPSSPVRYVLEVPANFAVHNNFQIGDTVAF